MADLAGGIVVPCIAASDACNWVALENDTKIVPVGTTDPAGFVATT